MGWFNWLWPKRAHGPTRSEREDVSIPGEESSDPRDRGTALRPVDMGLGWGKCDIPQLIAALRDPDAALRLAAAEAVDRFGPRARDAIPALVQALGDRSDVVRTAAAVSLGGFGPLAKAAVPALRLLLRDAGAAVRLSAAEALARIKPRKECVPNLLEGLRGQNGFMSDRTVRALGFLGSHAEAAVPDLIEWIPESGLSWDLHEPVAAALIRIGPTAVPFLVEVLRSDSPRVRAAAAAILGRIGPRAAAAVPALVTALRDGEPEVRKEAAAALTRIGRETAAALPVLLAMDPDDWKATEALGRVGAAAVPPLLERLTAAQARRKASPTGEPAIFDTDDPDVLDVIHSVNALGRVGPAALGALPALLDALADADCYIRRHAASAIGNLGPGAAAARPALLRALGYEDERVRLLAAGALARLGPGAVAALPVLLEELQAEMDGDRRAEAATYLASVGPEGRDAVPLLTRALRDFDARVRVESAGALWNIARQASETVPVLAALLTGEHGFQIEFLDDGSPRCSGGPRNGKIQARAAQILTEIGPDAAAAVPALELALRDPDEEVRTHAGIALRRVRPGGRSSR